MGKRSVKANKNEYQLAREAAGLTREAASERMDYVSADRIEKVEAERGSLTAEQGRIFCRPHLALFFCQKILKKD